MAERSLGELRACAEHWECRSVSALTAYLHNKLPWDTFEQTVAKARQACWDRSMAEAELARQKPGAVPVHVNTTHAGNASETSNGTLL